MTRNNRGFTRRGALEATAATVVGSGVVAADTRAAAGGEEDDEEDFPEELPPEVAEAVGIDADQAVQRQDIAAHHSVGWTIHIVVTSDTVCDVHGGERLDAFCTVRNNNAGHLHAARVWLLVGRNPQVVDRRTIQLPAQTIDHTRVGYGTYPVQQRVVFPLYVVITGPGGYDWDATYVDVYAAP